MLIPIYVNRIKVASYRNTHRPNQGDYIQVDGKTFEVEFVTWDDEESTFLVDAKPMDNFERFDTKEDIYAQAALMVREGMKLAAVKYVKETLNIGLKEAKDIVDGL